MHHETSVVGIGCFHKCLSPHAISRHDSLHVALKLSPQRKLWHKMSVAMRKHVANSHMVVAIAHFIVVIAFLWQ